MLTRTGKMAGQGTALAGLVVLCLAAGCGGGGRSPEESWGREVTVGEGIELYEPLAEVDSLPEFFTWRTATAASYSMALFDSSGARIATLNDLPAPSYEVDVRIGALVEPGVEYAWQVLAVDGSGSVIDGSPVGHFRLSPPAPEAAPDKRAIQELR
jgi:hypothetical protein